MEHGVKNFKFAFQTPAALVGRASVPAKRCHPGIRRRRISGIQPKAILSVFSPQSSLLLAASCQLYFPMLYASYIPPLTIYHVHVKTIFHFK